MIHFLWPNTDQTRSLADEQYRRFARESLSHSIRNRNQTLGRRLANFKAFHTWSDLIDFKNKHSLRKISLVNNDLPLEFPNCGFYPFRVIEFLSCLIRLSWGEDMTSLNHSLYALLVATDDKRCKTHVFSSNTW